MSDKQRDELKVGDRVRVKTRDVWDGYEGIVDLILSDDSTGYDVNVQVDRGWSPVAFRRSELQRIETPTATAAAAAAATAEDPALLTPHMARIRDLEAFIDFLREHPAITERVCYTRFFHFNATPLDAAYYAETMGGEWRRFGTDEVEPRMRAIARSFGALTLEIVVPVAVVEPDVAAEIAAAVEADADAPAFEPLNDDEPLLLTPRPGPTAASTETHETHETFIDANKRREQRDDERILSDVFGL